MDISENHQYHHDIKVDDDVISLHIHDVQNLDDINPECDVFLMAFSVTSRDSFESIPLLRDRIMEHRECGGDIPPLVVVATKTDCESQRSVSHSEVQFGLDIAAPVLETSAKTGSGVTECFRECVKQWMLSREDDRVYTFKERDEERDTSVIPVIREVVNKVIDVERGQNNDESSNLAVKYEKVRDSAVNSKDVMDINIAVIGSQNVGKHAMIQHFIG